MNVNWINEIYVNGTNDKSVSDGEVKIGKTHTDMVVRPNAFACEWSRWNFVKIDGHILGNEMASGRSEN